MSVEQITLHVIDALDSVSIPYLLAGSFSSNYWGIPRSTVDADFVIELRGRSLQSLRDHLPVGYVLDPQMQFETVTGTRRNVISVAGTEFTVELFRLSDDAHDRERFRRRVAVRLFDRDVSLPTPEDVIVTKLRWMRDKDRIDVRNVLAVQGSGLDWPYLERWAVEHATADALQELRREADALGYSEG